MSFIYMSLASVYTTNDSNSLLQERNYWRKFESKSDSIIETRSSIYSQIVMDAIQSWTAANLQFFPLAQIWQHSEIPTSVAQRFISTAETEINYDLIEDFMDYSFVVVEEHSDNTQVGPFLTTAWGQGFPYFNSCPLINSRHSLAGCVAVATGQIIRYTELIYIILNRCNKKSKNNAAK